MEPISRKELQEAKQAAIEAARQEAIRREELKGQLWAERMRTLVCQAATNGDMEYEADVGDLSPIAFVYALRILEALFPDSDIQTLVYSDTAKTIKISWD